MHIKFRYPKDNNSDVYLRVRYKVEVTDSKELEPWDDQFSGIYGLLLLNQIVAKEGGEWQSYGITLVGRTVIVVANGITVICDQGYLALQAGQFDSHKAEPGPLFLQGNHGSIEYQKIVVTPGK